MNGVISAESPQLEVPVILLSLEYFNHLDRSILYSIYNSIVPNSKSVFRGVCNSFSKELNCFLKVLEISMRIS